MKKEEYIETSNINGRLVSIGLDDNKDEATGYFNYPPTPEEFEKQMREIANTKSDCSGLDIECNHMSADELMCEVLSTLGYEKGVQIFKYMEKWYS